MLRVRKSGTANSPSFSTGDLHILYWRFFRPSDDRHSPFEMPYFHLVPCGKQEMANHRLPSPSKSKRVKIYIICKSSQLTSLLKSLFTNLTPSLWVLWPNSTTGRNKYSASIVGYNHNKVPKKKIHISWSPKYHMATRFLVIFVEISFHRKPPYTLHVLDYH
jgi:hypothetical protein